jgi:multicomponent Na+:H+ antiporter subunit E
MTPESTRGILVPVGESTTLRKTVAYAVSEAEATAEGAEREPVELHFVYPASWRVGDPTTEPRTERATELLERIAIWVREDLGIEEHDQDETDGRADNATEREGIALETELIGTGEYLFSPGDFARTLEAYADGHDLERVIVDPEYEPAGSAPMLRPLEFELEQLGLTVEEAPAGRTTRRTSLPERGSLTQFVSVFGLTYLFYLALGGFAVTDGFELGTGALSALIVAGVMWRVTLRQPVDPTESLKRLARFCVFLPYLLWEIAKANLSIAYVVLHPRLPIEPQMVRFNAAVWGDLPVTTLSNSITLTPGTLTVDVTDREFCVHALTTSTRSDLLGGSLERAVRFVFYGRAAASIASPTERGDDTQPSQVADGGGDPR